MEQGSEEEKTSASRSPASSRPPDLNVPCGPPEDRAASLREWLDRPGRALEAIESMHIFRQVVEMVKSAHEDGVVVGNVRPSCFVMSTFNRVSFIESASCSDEDDRGSVEKGGCSSDEAEEEEEKEAADREERKGAFPLKQVLSLEFNWYTSPEEVAGGPGTFESDIYRLGVLLFELLCVVGSMEEKLVNMANLRHRVLPPQFLLKWPKEASFCLWLLHPQPGSRPKMIDVSSSEFLNEPRNTFEDREVAIKLKDDIDTQEFLLDFLLQLQTRKQEVADKLIDTISCLSSDIEEVIMRQRLLGRFGRSLDDVGTKKDDRLSSQFDKNNDGETPASRKRFRQGLQNFTGEGITDRLPEAQGENSIPNYKGNILSKSSRLMKNFKKLESAYFESRLTMTRLAGRVQRQYTSVHRGSISRTEDSSFGNFARKEALYGGRGRWLNPFVDGLNKYLSFSRLKVRADLKQMDLLSSSNLVCSLGFDRDKEMFATAGVNKKIKVFECDIVLNEDRDIYYPVVEMVNSSKLSSICWNRYIKSQIASSDFEGAVQVWDVTRSRKAVEMREHGRRVWCVDYSLADPTKLASGGDDGTVKIWNTNQAGSTATIKTKAYVCSVQFPPESGYYVAVGSADHKIYYYDLRNLRTPVSTLVGHSKTVSYVKFVDSTTLLSASTDNSLKLWDLSLNPSKVVDSPVQTFTGHTNIKNFVGLSIYDDYIATGSETNEVFIYHKSFPMPMLSFRFDDAEPTSSVGEVDEATHFISCVCWRGRSSILVAANSSGCVKLLEMV